MPSNPDGKYRKLRLAGIDNVPIRYHREAAGVPKTATVKREPSGKWFVVITCETKATPVPDLTASLTGYDLGLSALVTDSDGATVAPVRSTRNSARKLSREQRRLSRCKNGSKRRAQQRRKVARVHEKIAAQRSDYRHKVTRRLVDDTTNKGFAFEDLRITNMLKNHKLAKAISDAAWRDFLTTMAYKAARAGKPFVLVDPRNTTQECSGCGLIVPKGLDERVHRCEGEGVCGLVLDRDENAARNIRRRGEARLKEWLEEAKPKPDEEGYGGNRRKPSEGDTPRSKRSWRGILYRTR